MTRAWAIGQLRHLYVQLVEGLVTQQAHAATHLLSPAIEALELADRAEAAPAAAQPPPDLARRDVQRGVDAAARVLAGQGIDTRKWLDLSPEAVEEVREALTVRAALAGAAQPRAEGALRGKLEDLATRWESCADRPSAWGPGWDEASVLHAQALRALLALPAAQPRAEGAQATHFCTICGARWRLNPPSAVQPGGSWSLAPGEACGTCCDNIEMGEQIRALVAAPRPETPPSHYADCNSRIGLECNCGAAPRPSTDKEGEP